MWLLEHDLRIGIVTAAGYTDGAKYKERLLGLLEAIKDSTVLTEQQKHNLVVLGGESSYMFRSAPEHKDLLEFVPRDEWALPEMKWEKEEVDALLDIAQASLLESVAAMNLPATLIRKEMAVGIIHSEGGKFPREQLEEAVLAAQKVLELSEVGRRLPFCAFNGGNDVFVDIGDKRLGVLCCQSFFGGLKGGQTLHIGDQFLSAGHNDFKARMAGTTV
jgi:IMP and pyridine-specific 5'-nucleotidase